jgi:hypothetical protein
VFVKGAGLLAGTGLLMRFVLPRLLHPLARSAELLVLFAIALAVSFAALGDHLVFSKVVGAFLAGVALASTDYREAIASRLASLRDFLLLFFFVNLGAKLELATLGLHVGPAVALSLFVLLGKPLLVVIVMGAMGYRKRTSFLAGLSLGQISEFSLILAALGRSLGHVGEEAVGLITLVGLVTITLSMYLILDSHRIYERLAPALAPFERRLRHREGDEAAVVGFDALVFGLGRFGNRIAHGLVERGYRVLGIDFDPQAVAACGRRGIPARYGDVEDPRLASTLPLGGVRWAVSAIPGTDVNLLLAHGLRHHGFGGRIALTAHTDSEAERLEPHADAVLLPFADAAAHAVEVVTGETPPSEPEPEAEDAAEAPEPVA